MSVHEKAGDQRQSVLQSERAFSVVMRSRHHLIDRRKIMETLVPAIKYIFVAGVAVEAVLILRSLFLLARDKARAAAATAQPAEE
jgi:hypothetical protein